MISISPTISVAVAIAAIIALMESYRACKSRGETMRDFRLPEPFDYRSDILTLKSLSRKSSLCLRTP